MVFLYVAEPGPWTNLIVACGMLTPFAIVPLVVFWLIVNKKLRAKYKNSVKKELQEKVLLHPLPVEAQVAADLAAGAVLLAVAARPVVGNSTIKKRQPEGWHF